METNALARKILTDLCTNSRVTLTELSSKYGVSRLTAKNYIRRLEADFGLHYTLELDYSKMGIGVVHVLRVKFSSMPQMEKLKEAFGSSRIAQLVCSAKGDFDLAIFALAGTSTEYHKWEMALALSFAEYGITIRSSEVSALNLGFVPLDASLVLASTRDEKYGPLLAALNEDSRMSIRELSKKAGMNEYLTRYYFRILGKTGLIKRFTAIATRSPLQSSILYFTNYTINKGIEERMKNERNRILMQREGDQGPLNEYQMAMSMSGSDMSFMWANYEDYKAGLKRCIGEKVETFKRDKPTIEQGLLKEVIKGYAPVRSIDQKEIYVDSPMSQTLF